MRKEFSAVDRVQHDKVLVEQLVAMFVVGGNLFEETARMPCLHQALHTEHVSAISETTSNTSLEVAAANNGSFHPCGTAMTPPQVALATPFSQLLSNTSKCLESSPAIQVHSGHPLLHCLRLLRHHRWLEYQSSTSRRESGRQSAVLSSLNLRLSVLVRRASSRLQ